MKKILGLALVSLGTVNAFASSYISCGAAGTLTISADGKKISLTDQSGTHEGVFSKRMASGTWVYSYSDQDGESAVFLSPSLIHSGEGIMEILAKQPGSTVQTYECSLVSN